MGRKLLLGALFLLAVPASALALSCPSGPNGSRTLCIFFGPLNLAPVFVAVVTQGALWIAGFVAALFLAGAFVTVLGAGDENLSKKGKDIMFKSLQGLAVTLSAYAIIRTVLYLIYA